MKIKSYIISSICGIICMLSLVGIFVFYVDPYLQYHVPNENMAYNMEMNSFSYYNPGIAKNYNYDTIVTGSSMSRAMMPSYIDEVFGGQTVKLSMAEARGKDFSILFSVVEQNPNLKRIIMGLDTFAFMVDKDYSSYEKPMYLYDNNPLNDGLYLMNMDGVLESKKVLDYTANGGTTTSMDDYQNYVSINTFSRENVIQWCANVFPAEQSSLTNREELKQRIVENLEQNLIPTIEKNKEVEFLFYFPPYSIVRWGNTSNIAEEMESMKTIVERLIRYENVSLYFYQGEQDVITDLDHYMDTIHFDSIVANKIVDYIADDDNKLTVDNYANVLDEFEAFLKNYDYVMLME